MPANEHAHADEEENEEFVLRADINNSVNHCDWASAEHFRLRKTPPFWATNASATSCRERECAGRAAIEGQLFRVLDLVHLGHVVLQAITRLSST